MSNTQWSVQAGDGILTMLAGGGNFLQLRSRHIVIRVAASLSSLNFSEKLFIANFTLKVSCGLHIFDLMLAFVTEKFVFTKLLELRIIKFYALLLNFS